MHGLPEGDHSVAVISCPGGQAFDGIDKGLAEIREPVLGATRLLIESFDKAEFPEPTQRLREHLLRDSSDEFDEFPVPARLLAEPEQNEHRPLVGDDLDRQAGGTVHQKDRSCSVLHEVKGTSK